MTSIPHIAPTESSPSEHYRSTINHQGGMMQISANPVQNFSGDREVKTNFFFHFSRRPTPWWSLVDPLGPHKAVQSCASSEWHLSYVQTLWPDPDSTASSNCTIRSFSPQQNNICYRIEWLRGERGIMDIFYRRGAGWKQGVLWKLLQVFLFMCNRAKQYCPLFKMSLMCFSL